MREGFLITLVIGITLLTTVACKSTDSLFVEINLDDANKKVKSSLNQFYDKNGIYLLQENDTSRMYLFLNGYNVELGKNAMYYTNVNIEFNEETLVISFSEEYAEDNQNKVIKNRLLYKINRPENIECISVLKNGQEVPINSIIVDLN